MTLRDTCQTIKQKTQKHVQGAIGDTICHITEDDIFTAPQNFCKAAIDCRLSVADKAICQ